MTAAADRPIVVTRLQAHAFRVPVDPPVATAFGTMRDRPAVFVRVEDADGAFGWGEVFANWPAAGAEHRVNLLRHDVADVLLGVPFADPPAAFEHLTARCRTRALQCAEPGPFAQAIAGLDTAIWDLAARRGGLPLRRLLDADAAGDVAAYASGIDVRRAGPLVDAARAAGHAAFKLKVGFDAHDADRVREVAAALGAGQQVMIDANQAYDPDGALALARALADVPLRWFEEPIAADAPDAHWRRVADGSPHPLAAGENGLGLPSFERLLATGAVAVIQPDVAKWGGVTGCRAVARLAHAAGATYAPHFLGGGIGLRASLHLLAAGPGRHDRPGPLEVDVNPNPLRDAFGPLPVRGGRIAAGDAPGLGIDRLPEGIERHRTLSAEARA
ncbi:mandelate racemase/muconate lactonizing enzyme family protein [Jannaschia sp. LMIT008]|uniref:mandelate racemase/muconate lactonizing enzyme family protein n=1 Tax=Jannaschia maritima TaxID=3032585 RepID=UPI0028128258|nr:mandelate racemase/muconate lactonizing enzyme family protein [Jannaschia sp. LMIT008]